MAFENPNPELQRLEATPMAYRPDNRNFLERIWDSIFPGAVNEVQNNWPSVLSSAGVGVALGALSIVAPPIGIAGLAYLGYKVFTEGGEYLHDINIASNPYGRTQTEVTSAEIGLQSLGGIIVEGAAGAVGGAIGAAAASAHPVSIGETVLGNGQRIMAQGTLNTAMKADARVRPAPIQYTYASNFDVFKPLPGIQIVEQEHD